VAEIAREDRRVALADLGLDGLVRVTSGAASGVARRFKQWALPWLGNESAAEATPDHRLQLWGVFGGTTAAIFAAWMLFFPESIATQFAWNVHPRLSQAFIGAGYLFRTAFFFSAALEPRWWRVRWIFWGNLVFTGTLLFATYWHADLFTWGQFVPPTAHLWIVLYIFEPVTLLYLVPRGDRARAPVETSGGPIVPLFRAFLVLEAGLLLMHGLLLLINPEFAARRWPWELNPLDARIMAAWLLGWSAWAGTMAFARDWDEIRLAARLNIVNGLALLATVALFLGLFDFSGKRTTLSYVGGLVFLTAGMLLFYYVQERRRPQARFAGRSPAPPIGESSEAPAG
jgi:hypothetical protein